jgi:hypothetical protein
LGLIAQRRVVSITPTQFLRTLRRFSLPHVAACGPVPLDCARPPSSLAITQPSIVWLWLRRCVLHPFEFFAVRDDSAVTLAPEGRQIVAQCVSTGNGVQDRRAPERGGRTGDVCLFRPPGSLGSIRFAACRSAWRAIVPNATWFSHYRTSAQIVGQTP